MKKLFIKLIKLLGYEVIDQNRFSSPTLNKRLNEDLSIFNKKSIILPLGEVKISRKVNSLLIILRINTEVEIWDQNKKRLFEQPKIEYSIRSLNSLLKSIKFCEKKYTNLKIKTILIDDNSTEKNLIKINKCGKVVVTKNKEEEKILEQLFERGIRNGSELIRKITRNSLDKKATSLNNVIFLTRNM